MALTTAAQLSCRRSCAAGRRDFLGKLEPCLIGMEACPSAHFWAREIAALDHEVRLIPPAYVKPYVKRQKNDAADAEAICEAVTRPNMRFVPIKTEDQQAVLVLHRLRDLLMRQCTMILNASVHIWRSSARSSRRDHGRLSISSGA
jgi:transposase